MDHKLEDEKNILLIRLPDLPYEILARIIGELRLPDFYGLARSCRDLYALFCYEEYDSLFKWVVWNDNPLVSGYLNNRPWEEKEKQQTKKRESWKSIVRRYCRIKRNLDNTEPLNITEKMDLYTCCDTPTWRFDDLPSEPSNIIGSITEFQYPSFQDKIFNSSRVHWVGTNMADASHLLYWFLIDFKKGNLVCWDLNHTGMLTQREEAKRLKYFPFVDPNGNESEGELDATFTWFLHHKPGTKLVYKISSTFCNTMSWKISPPISSYVYQLISKVVDDTIYISVVRGSVLPVFIKAYKRKNDDYEGDTLLWTTSLNNRDLDYKRIECFIPHEHYLFILLYGESSGSRKSLIVVLLRTTGKFLGAYDTTTINNNLYFIYTTPTHIFCPSYEYINDPVLFKPLMEFIGELDTKSYSNWFTNDINDRNIEEQVKTCRGQTIYEEAVQLAKYRDPPFMNDWRVLLDAVDIRLTSIMYNQFYIGEFEFNNCTGDSLYHCLFLYDMETGEKKYFKHQYFEDDFETIGLYISDEMKVVGLTNEFFMKMLKHMGKSGGAINEFNFFDKRNNLQLQSIGDKK